MILLYFYLFLCQGNIRHILYASVKTGRLKLSKGEGTKTPPTPLHTSPLPVFAWFCCVWSGRWYDPNICIHICEEIESSADAAWSNAARPKDKRQKPERRMMPAKHFSTTRAIHVNFFAKQMLLQSGEEEVKAWERQRRLLGCLVSNYIIWFLSDMDVWWCFLGF